MQPDRGLPSTARVVVIGGGVGGASVAYHLAELGERDVLLVDRDELTSGSTFHSAGMVGQLRADPTLTRMNMYSVELYRRLQLGPNPPGWVESGGIRLASSVERMEELRRQLSWARTFGLALEEISPATAAEMFPYLDLTGVIGAVHLASDGYLDPAQLTYALAAAARASGVGIHTGTRVLGIDTEAGRVRRVRTDRGDVDCEVVVNCGGMFAAEIGRMAGVRIPIVPMSHQYLITEGFREPTAPVLPSLRDPDLLIYFRQEGRGLLMGGYERQAAPFTAGRTRLDAIPADFNGRLLPEDWPRFEEITGNSQRRVPLMAEVGLKKIINGPEAFTPDNEFCLGETTVDGLYVAAGFNAHGIAGAGGIGRLLAEWIVTGSPSMDVWHMDIRRFGPQFGSPSLTLARTVENYQTYYDIRFPGHEVTAGRPLRTSPVYRWHLDRGAVMGEKNGWERVNHYGCDDGAEHGWRPDGWAARAVAPATAAEHRATRAAVGLYDETSFAKIAVRGPGAADLLEWVCDNRVARAVGAVTYTQALNARGGIEADFTVTRTAEDEFLIVTGTAFGPHDLAWLRQQARASGSGVRIDDITGQYVCFALWGPRSRELLERLTAAGLGDDDFPFMTSQEIVVGDVGVRALRVTFVGELGWELYAPVEYGLRLWQQLHEAGAPLGLIPCGYRAIDSLRLEKGYRVWGSDVTAETTPLEAGLDFCVRWNKPGGFLGREALLEQRSAGVARRMCCLVLDEPSQVVLGGEPVRVGVAVLGRVTSGGYGYTVEKSIAYCYLPVEVAVPGTAVEIDLFGRWVSATVTAEPLLDPTGTRIRP